MSWTSGAELAGDVWVLISNILPQEEVSNVAHEIIELFKNRDCDNLCGTLLWDAAFKECPRCSEEYECGSCTHGYVRKCVD